MNKKRDQKILIVQTEKQKLQDVAHCLNSQYTQVVTVTEPQAFAALESLKPDLIFTEYSVSDMTGILFYKKLLNMPEYCLTPTVFIADSKSYDHRLNAFELGAADFIHRPFTDEDILKKAQIYIRNRRFVYADQSVQIGNMRLYPDSESVLIDNEPVALTQLEYKILYNLLTIPRQVITRTEIYEKVWGHDQGNTGRLDTQLYNLKKKIRKFNGKIKSVNKIGMRILAEGTTFYQESKKTEPQSQPQEPLP